MVSILVFIAVLSVLIFFHELGHFLAAKACGIYVDRFSIGMPPRVAGIKIGETDYCIGALPIGGFVKMAGQEDSPLDEEEREKQYGHVPPERWFNNRPVWQRFIVILAGPLMNVVLAIVLYAALASMGYMVTEPELEARIGKVDPNYPAATAPLYEQVAGTTASDSAGEPDAVGWQTGDIVREVNGDAVESYFDLAISAILGGEGATHWALIERPGLDGGATRYLSPVTPQKREEDENPRYGVGPFTSAYVGEVMAGMPAAAAGLQAEDVIVAADGKLVSSDTFVELTENAPADVPLALEIDRGGQRLEVTVTPVTIGRITGLVLGPPEDTPEDALEAAPVVVYGVEEDAVDWGIKRRDRIAEVNGEPVTLGELRQIERERPGEVVQVTVDRPSVLFGLIQKPSVVQLELPIEAVRAVGVKFQPLLVPYDVPKSEIVTEGFRESYKAIALTLHTLKALVSGTVSAKALGGPVMIFDVTTKAAEAGFNLLLKMMAFISINLAVFNLLPLPVLDGGLLVINAIEAIRRKPLSPKFQERFQQVGLIFIISLMLFVTWNDIGRLIDSITP